VVVDAGHELGVRAWRVRPDGERGPLSEDDVDAARLAAASTVVAVVGDDQTDLVPVGTSKAAAVRALLARLDPAALEQPEPLAFAAGDGPADIEMLGLAALAVVPSHAAHEVRAAATEDVPGAFQAGLADGVALLVGHRPGGCPTCAVDLPATSQALLRALSVREAGPRGIPSRLARLAAEVPLALRRSSDRPAAGRDVVAHHGEA
jgi:hypothetical protein